MEVDAMQTGPMRALRCAAGASLLVVALGCSSSAGAPHTVAGSSAGSTREAAQDHAIDENGTSESLVADGTGGPHSLGDVDRVAVEGYEYEVPAPEGPEFDVYEVFEVGGIDGERLSVVQFRVDGPMEGTTIGALSIAFDASPGTTQEQVGHTVDAVNPGRDTEVAGRAVVVWDEVEALDGSDIGQDRRDTLRYAWVTDEEVIVQVTSDALPPVALESYISDLMASLS